MKIFSTRNSYPGFTIVELLIVIVIIAVLAAISIVAYNGIQNRARASAASSSLAQAKKKLELYKVDNGSYPTSGNLTSAGITNSDVDYQYTSNGTTYCITGTAGNVSYKASDSTSPTQGGCSGHGQGGVAAITNLATNPSFESNTNTWAASSASFARSTIGAASGTYSGLITPTGTSTDTFARIGGTNTLIASVVPGATYTVSGAIYLPTPQAGSLDSRARGITIYSWNGSTASLAGQSTIPANSAGSTRVTVTFSVPSTVTGLEIRFYNGATNSASNLVYWDSIMLTSGTTPYTFADGSSPDWVWTDTPNNSTSTGPPL